MEHVYFPQNAMVSLVSHTAAGESVEVGVVGFEGIAGISSVLGVDRSSHEVMVQIPDGEIQVSVSALRKEFKRGGALHDQVRGCSEKQDQEAQINEALCKVLCHNICCLIQSMYELNLKPKFWSVAA